MPPARDSAIAPVPSPSVQLASRATPRVEMQRQDEIGRLVAGFNEFVAKLQTIMQTMKRAQASLGDIGEELATSAHESPSAISEILANIEGVRRQASNQAASAETAAEAMETVATGIAALDKLIETQAAGNTEAAASIEEMVGNIASVTASVEKMAQRFSALMDAASEGKVKQEAVDGRVKEIASQSELLMEANEIITGIESWSSGPSIGNYLRWWECMWRKSCHATIVQTLRSSRSWWPVVTYSSRSILQPR